MRILFFMLLLIPFFGNAQINQTDENGLRQGFWRKKQVNGKLMYEGSFKDGKPVGDWKRYHAGGQIKAQINYVGDSAKTILFDEMQNKIAEGVYIKQKKEGVWKLFSENRLIASEIFLAGVKNGISKKFYETGGVMERSEWVNGVKQGDYQLFYKTGEPYLQCKMAKDQRNGLCIISFKNGRNQLIAAYKNSLRDGEWKYYNEQGEYLYSLHYNMGKLLNPELRDSIDNAKMQELEKNKGTFLDPEKFMENPGEYMMKMKIYK